MTQTPLHLIISLTPLISKTHKQFFTCFSSPIDLIFSFVISFIETRLSVYSFNVPLLCVLIFEIILRFKFTQTKNCIIFLLLSIEYSIAIATLIRYYSGFLFLSFFKTTTPKTKTLMYFIRNFIFIKMNKFFNIINYKNNE